MGIREIGSAVQTAAAPTEKIHDTPMAPAPKAAADPVQTAAPDAVQQPAQVPNLGQLAQALKSINNVLKPQNVEFSVDPDSDRTIVKVVDQSTKEVLRQIPAEDVLHIAKVIEQQAERGKSGGVLPPNGLLIQQKA